MPGSRHWLALVAEAVLLVQMVELESSMKVSRLSHHFPFKPPLATLGLIGALAGDARSTPLDASSRGSMIVLPMMMGLVGASGMVLLPSNVAGRYPHQ